jgi:hypothetical protein
MLNIMFAELIEGNYVLYQGDLSTNRLLLGNALVLESQVIRTSPQLWIVNSRVLAVSTGQSDCRIQVECSESGPASRPIISINDHQLKAPGRK